MLLRSFHAILLVTLLLAPAVHAEEITQDGQRLAKALDGMDVEHKWLPGHYVKWKTGEATDRPVTDGKTHSHCSAFAAAVCMKLDVYLLRPPDHSETLLANAQCDWLGSDGEKQGWKPVKTLIEAQRLANRGQLLLAVYKEADAKKSGHVALVRPSTKTAREIEAEGPQVIQAGASNYFSTSVKEGFKHHPMAWKEHAIKYFAHDVKWPAP